MNSFQDDNILLDVVSLSSQLSSVVILIRQVHLMQEIVR